MAEASSYTEKQREEVEASPVWRELDGRQSQWLYISLDWLKKLNVIRISVINERKNSYWEQEIPNDKGLDALAHPFAYQGEAEEKYLFEDDGA